MPARFPFMKPHKPTVRVVRKWWNRELIPTPKWLDWKIWVGLIVADVVIWWINLHLR